MVTWTFNGVNIDISDISKYRVLRAVISETVVESSLVIMGVALFDVGMYTCIAENEAGNDTSNSVLRVQG